MNTCINQRTLKNVIRATGVGLHTGAQVRITLRPAPPDHGIVFVRTDLVPAVRLPARVEQAGATSMASTLTVCGVRLSSVEHLLAAFAGLGIDNALVEVDAQELPIMDGSAGPFVFLLQSAGIASQEAPRRYMRVRKPVVVRDGDAWAELRPYAGCRLEYTVEYEHAASDQQRRSTVVELSPTAFVREIARARTYGFLSEGGLGQRSNPIVGSCLDRRVVLNDQRSSGDADRRIGDEFVRHKILDAIGDLYLLGHGLIGAFAGFRSGHGTNRALLERFLDDRDAWEVVTFADRADLPGALGRPIAETA